MDEQSLFLGALERDGAEREAWLADACGADTALQQRIHDLLAHHEAAGDLLEAGLGELDATFAEGAVEDLEAKTELGPLHQSVLKSLGTGLEEVPQVTLREPAERGIDPITRPGSAEMPRGDSDSRYQLQGEIARGGMGAILKGRDTDLGRDLAIKVLLESHKDKPEVIQRFVEEAQIGGQLQHPGIAPVYELGQFADQRPFFSMKLVKGETLSKLLAARKDPAADRGRFLGIFEQVCQTMAYAHSRGVIHRDLKPSNVMVGAFGEVQVMDWGLAKVLPMGGVADEKTSQRQHVAKSIIQTRRSVGSDTPGSFGSAGSDTQMGSVMGTPAYMPPEQALGEIDQLDQRADVFGLGAMLCEILTGCPPYVADDPIQVFRLASRGKLAACFERLDASGADPELIAVTKHCLELEPEDRPADAGELTERVTGYLVSVETKLRQAEVQRATNAARAEEERKRLRVTIALAATVLLAAGLGVTVWIKEQQASFRQTQEVAAQVSARLDEARLEARKATMGSLERAVGIVQHAKQLAQAGAIDTSIAQAKRLEADMQSRLVAARDRLADQEFLAALDAIWESGLALDDETFDNYLFNFDHAAAARLYEEAFRERGLALTGQSIEATADAIGRSAIKENLVLALEGWAHALHNLKAINPDAESPIAAERLLAIANTVDPDAWRRGFRQFVADGDIERLAEIAEDTDILKVQSAQRLAALGITLLNARRYAEGITVLQQGQRRFPDEFWINLALVTGHTRLGNFDKAIEFGRAAHASRQDSTEALLRMLPALILAEREEEAIGIAERVTEETESIRAHIWHWIALLRKHQGDQADAALEAAFQAVHEAIKHSPSASSYYSLGFLALRTGDHATAIDATKQAVARAPHVASYHRQLGRAYQLNGDGENALRELKTAARIDPRDTLVLGRLAQHYVEEGNLDSAIAALEQVMSYDERNTSLPVLLSNLYQMRGQLDKAVSLMVESIRRDEKGESSEKQLALGRLYLLQGNFAAAIGPYQQHANSGQHRARATVYLGIALRESDPDRKDEAETVLAIARLLDRGSAKPGARSQRVFENEAGFAHNNAAWGMVHDRIREGEQRHFPIALELANQAVALQEQAGFSPHPHLLNTIGVTKYRLEDWTGAIAALQRSQVAIDGGIEEQPLGASSTPVNYLFIAMAHRQLGNQMEANAWFEKAQAWRKTNDWDRVANYYLEADEVFGKSD